jgi:hypothetical protein
MPSRHAADRAYQVFLSVYRDARCSYTAMLAALCDFSGEVTGMTEDGRVIAAAAAAIGIPPRDIVRGARGGRSRVDVGDARAVAAYVLHCGMGLNMSDVARALGGLDRSTILACTRRCEQRPRLRGIAEDVLRAVRPPTN